MNLAQLFRGQLIGERIKNFPYPDKYCKYCNKKTELVDAIHISASPEEYKALYICYNPSCQCYDEEAGQAYAKVYYSSEYAYERLETNRIFFDRMTKR